MSNNVYKWWDTQRINHHALPGLTPYVPPHTESYYPVTLGSDPNLGPTGDHMLSVKPKVVTDLFLLPFFPTMQSYLTENTTDTKGDICASYVHVYVTHLSAVGDTLFDGIKTEKLTKQQSKIFCCCSINSNLAILQNTSIRTSK